MAGCTGLLYHTWTALLWQEGETMGNRIAPVRADAVDQGQEISGQAIKAEEGGNFAGAADLFARAERVASRTFVIFEPSW